MWTFWIAVATAGAPVVATDASGIVRARAVVSASSSEVLALVRDPSTMHAISGDSGTLTSVPSGSCFAISYHRSSVMGPIAYTSRACPTAQGIRSELVESETFRQMTSEWTVRATPAGTEISYIYQADVSLAVPTFLLRRSTEAAITEMMTHLVARLDSPTG